MYYDSIDKCILFYSFVMFIVLILYAFGVIEVKEEPKNVNVNCCCESRCNK